MTAVKRSLLPLLALTLVLCAFDGGAMPQRSGAREEALPVDAQLPEPFPEPSAPPEEIPQEEALPGLGTVSRTDYLSVDGLYADRQSGVLYFLYTVTAGRRPLSVDCKSARILVDGGTVYQSAHIPGACALLPGYTYSDYLTNLSPGESGRFAETFRIPPLGEGQVLTFEKAQVPETDQLLLTADQIFSFDTVENLALSADPEGCAAETRRRASADADTIARVHKRIRRRSWTLETVDCRVAFPETGRYELTLKGVKSSGSYTVCNGYLRCDGSSATAWIPYTYGDDDAFFLDLFTAFDPGVA